MKTEAVQPDKGGYWQGGRKKGLIFWRERSLPPAFFIVFQKKMHSYRISEQHTDR